MSLTSSCLACRAPSRSRHRFKCGIVISRPVSSQYCMLRSESFPGRQGRRQRTLLPSRTHQVKVQHSNQLRVARQASIPNCLSSGGVRSGRPREPLDPTDQYPIARMCVSLPISMLAIASNALDVSTLTVQWTDRPGDDLIERVVMAYAYRMHVLCW